MQREGEVRLYMFDMVKLCMEREVGLYLFDMVELCVEKEVSFYLFDMVELCAESGNFPALHFLVLYCHFLIFLLSGTYKYNIISCGC